MSPIKTIVHLGLIASCATLCTVLGATNTPENWFVTWDRPEYKEWAQQIPEGYTLHIIRKETHDTKDNFLVVKAKLIMGTKGLPGFEVEEQCNLPTEQQALKQVKLWEEKQAGCATFEKEEL